VPKTDYKKLIKEVRGCSICMPHLPMGPNPVFRIHPKAKILVAGQAPGIRVHKTGIPFNDPSGVRLRNWMGLDEETFYNQEKVAIIPMAFCYPGTGERGDLPPRKECADTWRQDLLSFLPDLQLTLTIGIYAIHWHLKDNKKKNLTETVKAWKEYLPNGVLPLPHPSPRNNIWLKKNPWFEEEVLGELKSKIKSILSS
jgi:uracil-DNA glycosylase